MATATSPFKMKAPPKGEGGDVELCPAGNHPATLVGLIDLGTQTKTYGGKGEAKTAHRIAFVFELMHEHKTNGTPFCIAHEVTASLHEKSALRALLKGWRGKDIAEGEEFDLGVTLGKPCMVSVVHKEAGERTVANVANISGIPKGLPVAAPAVEPFAYALDDGDFPDKDWLPYLFGKSIKDTIEDSHEKMGTVPPPNRPAARNGAATAPAKVTTLNDPDDPDFDF
jgi:hypothetical protein